eukprot:CAMPEP_0197651702 /NCGR_PEP_ID=MMETSP1338-20131121/33724_1 /TAXON_ID=43686 ORGANISM="Pelagodinium beii, Strain RCC1491" /NCGR_SAMPLE_ID=MMETSP1338 /ASSEMBLY_ACC=CAM_ASM_000754 /LENGTH=77 /DNA_ID=CAMNT_0043226415 /DNA_START=184 /DNA_END=417 /DNA_ORIENTATION=-
MALRSADANGSWMVSAPPAKKPTPATVRSLPVEDDRRLLGQGSPSAVGLDEPSSPAPSNSTAVAAPVSFSSRGRIRR